jgi:CubicO group peptidase (beta-lactamase class C family)
MKGLICLLSCATMSLAANAAQTDPSALPRSTPEKQGISSAAILDFVESADRQIDTLHSFMLVRHGNVVAEGWWSPCHPQVPHSMFSLSKSFTSTAVGLAIAEGKLSLDDSVLKFFPEDAPANPSDNLKAMLVRDLLIMSAGHNSNDLAQFSFDAKEVLTREFLALPVEHKPGTFFLYNTPGSYMLSAMVQKATGQTVLDYLTPRLFEPLGIAHPTWDDSPQGISKGGVGLNIRTEDIARFGQLYLQKGKWQGKQLVPADWVAAATSRQTSNGSNPASDWEQGYGYQFWRCRHGLFRGDGRFGQFCIVMPEQDAVVAITSATGDMAGVMNLVWDKLLAAMQPKPLHADPDGDGRLRQALGNLQLHLQEGSASPGAAASCSGRRYLFPTNDQNIEAAALEFSDANAPVVLTLRCDGADYRLPCGRGRWAKSDLRYAKWPQQPVATSGAWTADGTYTARIWLYETPFRITLNLRFNGNELAYDAEYNLAEHGPTKQPELIGHFP